MPDQLSEDLDPTLSAEERAEARRSLFSKILLWVSAVIVGGLFLVVIGVSFRTCSEEIQWSNGPGDLMVYPVTGEYAEIVGVDTAWVNDAGDFRPISKIYLGKASKAGSLRLLYMNDQDRKVGSLQAVDFSDGGKFTDGAAYTFHSDDGMDSEGDFSAYLTEQTPYWHLVIMEAATGATSMESYKEVARIPIARKFH